MTSPLRQDAGAGKHTDWRAVTRMLDSMPHGQQFKTKYQFTRADVISIVGHYRNRCDELQELVKYEQEKNRAKLESHEGLIEELKAAKLQKRQYQEKADQIPDLQQKIERHELQIEQCVQ